jgi:hypothetical protein
MHLIDFYPPMHPLIQRPSEMLVVSASEETPGVNDPQTREDDPLSVNDGRQPSLLGNDSSYPLGSEIYAIEALMGETERSLEDARELVTIFQLEAAPVNLIIIAHRSQRSSSRTPPSSLDSTAQTFMTSKRCLM